MYNEETYNPELIQAITHAYITGQIDYSRLDWPEIESKIAQMFLMPKYQRLNNQVQELKQDIQLLGFQIDDLMAKLKAENNYLELIKERKEWNRN